MENSEQGPRKGPKCTGWAKTENRRCINPPMKGGKVCRKHGGAAPQVRAAAQRRLLTQEAEADAEAILARQGLAPVADPYDALSRLANEMLALKSAWASRVNALSSIRVESEMGFETAKLEIGAYERALGMAARVLEVLAKLNLDERRVRITEAIGEQVTAAIREILAGLALTAEQEALAPTVVSKAMLRLVEAV